MAYDSVDKLQNVLASEVFKHTKDAKKAAGRALGTLVEIITFYMLKSRGFEYSVSIERSLPEYGNPEIVHNVEYSLHPVLRKVEFDMCPPTLPLTALRIMSNTPKSFNLTEFQKTTMTLLSTNGVLRNSCVVGKGRRSHLVATLSPSSVDDTKLRVVLVEQYSHPYAIFECKRVGIEEGMNKGPQTIEKAKQGAYVAKAISSLQKVRTASGKLRGLIYRSDDSCYSKPYAELISEVIRTTDPTLLRDFVLTVGVVSNHGNWFTSDDHNKELRVLAQAYDWLLFLTDEGLSEFITEMLLKPQPTLAPARAAFLSSYAANKKKNQFTKVQMALDADLVLRTYFKRNPKRIEGWFNVITPEWGSMSQLGLQLSKLRDKPWQEIHSL